MEDALAQNKSNERKRRTRIAEQNKEKRKSAEELEREHNRKLMKTDSSVWRILNELKVKSARAEYELFGDPLEMPFKNERERIKIFSEQFKDLTIVEAFARNYKEAAKLNKDLGNELPLAVAVGSLLNLRFNSISKAGVVFDAGVHKESFITRNNLARFDKLTNHTPKEPVQCRVVEIGKNDVIVDVFGPMMDEFILPRANEPWTQNLIQNYVPVKVKNLKLVRGGYIGQAVIPNVSEFVGEEFVIPAFVPGSQIVQNTTDNFEQFEGQDIETFITSYSATPHRGLSLVCSAKNLIKHRGNLRLKELHAQWCEQEEAWKKLSETVYAGKVTGVINSSKKCGAFVEIPELEITGMIQLKPEELVNFPAGQQIKVKLTNFDEDMFYNAAAGQYQHLPAFEIERGAIKRINIKPVLELVSE